MTANAVFIVDADVTSAPTRLMGHYSAQGFFPVEVQRRGVPGPESVYHLWAIRHEYIALCGTADWEYLVIESCRGFKDVCRDCAEVVLGWRRAAKIYHLRRDTGGVAYCGNARAKDKLAISYAVAHVSTHALCRHCLHCAKTAGDWPT